MKCVTINLENKSVRQNRAEHVSLQTPVNESQNAEHPGLFVVLLLEACFLHNHELTTSSFLFYTCADMAVRPLFSLV